MSECVLCVMCVCVYPLKSYVNIEFWKFIVYFSNHGFGYLNKFIGTDADLYQRDITF